MKSNLTVSVTYTRDERTFLLDVLSLAESIPAFVSSLQTIHGDSEFILRELNLHKAALEGRIS